MAQRTEPSEDEADLAAKLVDESLELEAGRVTLEQCVELGRLIDAARLALSKRFPRKFTYHGRNYRLQVRGRLFLYIGDEVPDPAYLPLVPEGVDLLDSFSDDLKPR